MEALSYDDVLLVPQLGVLEKREDADLVSLAAKDVIVDIPIISAPMPSVTEGMMAYEMLNLGGQAIIHRFQSVEDRLFQFTEAAKLGEQPFVAVGLKEGMTAVSQLNRMGTAAKRFCLDVAHGHHKQVIKLAEQIKNLSDDIVLMVGNIATPSGALALAQCGADAIKVGIGPGAACSTREVTGFGVPQFTAIQNVRQQIDAWGFDIPIVADGGIKNSGDAVKAFVAGASTIMLGSLLAGADEAPKPGEYYGNASGRVNGHHAPEGAEGSVPLTGPVEGMIKKLIWGIRSGISYAGVTSLDELYGCEYVRVGQGTALESSVRV